MIIEILLYAVALLDWSYWSLLFVAGFWVYMYGIHLVQQQKEDFRKLKAHRDRKFSWIPYLRIWTGSAAMGFSLVNFHLWIALIAALLLILRTETYYFKK